MACPKCGNEHDAKFCPECGTPAGKPVKSPPKKAPKGCMVVVGILFFFMVLLIIIGTLGDDNDEPTSTSETLAANAKMTTEPTTKPEAVPVDVQDVDYVLFYADYTDAFEGKWVRISGPVFATGTDHLTIRDGLGGGVTETLQVKITNEYAGKLREIMSGQYVTVVGLVESKFMGLLTLESARIEEIGGNAEQAAADQAEMRQKILDERIAEYKKSAENVSYEKLVREPYNYEGKVIKVTIKVSQIMTGGILTESGYRGYANGSKEEWYINYELPDNVPRILEGDKITFYGEFVGVVEMTRALTNTKEYVPKMKALYYN